MEDLPADLSLCNTSLPLLFDDCTLFCRRFCLGWHASCRRRCQHDISAF
jgi:hypothetical protein